MTEPGGGSPRETIPYVDYPLTGPCQHKQDERHDCIWRTANGPVVCNMLHMDQIRRCPRYYRMCELHKAHPELWGETCCPDYRQLMLKCAEESGFAAGCVDVRIYPNDGKDVWRNYMRVKVRFCPYCGAAKEE